MEVINTKVFNGALIMVLLRFFIKTLGLISTLILARIISPEDFGLVAIVMSIYALIEMLKAFGFDVVLIQKKNPSDDMYNTTWTIQFAFGLLACLLMYLIAPFIAHTFNDNRLESIAKAIAALFFISGLANIGTVNFRKELDFKLEFIFMSLPKIFAVITTISIAIIYRSYWALISGMFISSLSQTILSYVLSKFRPKFCISEFKELFGFSSWLMLGAFLNYTNVKLKDLVVGKTLGAKYTGLLSVADEIASLPTAEVVAAINRATFPGYTKVAHDNKALKELFLNALSFIALLGIPSSLGISLTAPYLVPVILGDKWLEIIPLVQVLGFAYALICINTNASYIFLARGKPKINALISLVRVIILISLMLALMPTFGIIGFAIALLVTAIIMFPTYFILLKKELNLSIFDYLSVLWRPFFSSIIMYISTYWLFFGVETQIIVSASTVSFFDFMSIILVGVSIYILSIVLLWKISKNPHGAESIIYSKIIPSHPKI